MAKIDDELFKRLVLYNQYRILAAVDPDESETWDRAAEAVRGHLPMDELPAVDWMLEAARDPFTETDRALVQDVLDLYRWLQRAEDNAAVAPEEPMIFPGFDGNGETKHMAFARDLVIRQGRWQGVRMANKDLNSHHPTLEMYERMLEEWRGRGEPATLSAKDYEAIKRAQIHPSNR